MSDYQNYTATETCSCGASITVGAYTTADLRLALNEFRMAHVQCRTTPVPYVVPTTYPWWNPYPWPVTYTISNTTTADAGASSATSEQVGQ